MQDPVFSLDGNGTDDVDVVAFVLLPGKKILVSSKLLLVSSDNKDCCYIFLARFLPSRLYAVISRELVEMSKCVPVVSKLSRCQPTR